MAEQTSAKSLAKKAAEDRAKERRVQVIATERGYDSDAMLVREVGDVFTVRASLLAKRPKLDEKGRPIEGQFYDPPSWFEEAVAAPQPKPANLVPRSQAGDLGPDKDPKAPVPGKPTAGDDLV